MKNIILTFKVFILFSLVAILFSNCKKAQETPEEFVNRLITIVQDGDESALFGQCFVNSKKEIKKMVTVTSGRSSYSSELDDQIDDMYDAVQEDKNRVLRKLRRRSLGDWHNITLDSVITKNRLIEGFGNEIPFPKGYRGADITVYITKEGYQTKVVIPCMDLNTGMWKMIGYPSFNQM